ncbi:MAG: GGDEF domain-containing protein [Lachnospiraceae bacterium]|nr:GGDEF domain-containing protein [Lachnospiraceae bacterium]
MGLKVEKVISDDINNTSQIKLPDEFILSDRIEPRLFVCLGRTITEYELSGKQTVGRPSSKLDPDIAIADSHVSRSHGYFITRGDIVEYVAEETTNGVYLNGKLIIPTGCADLNDGDELTIPSWRENKREDITLAVAMSREKINFWRNLRDSSRDMLTGLSARENFLNWWIRSLNKPEFEKAYFFMLDIDDFKKINDTWGHAAGDEVLKKVSEMLISFFGNKEQICRFGGDEFIGIFPGEKEDARKKIDEIGKGITVKTKKADIEVTFSIGITNITEVSNRADIEEIINTADAALYMAKKSGKNRICELK